LRGADLRDAKHQLSNILHTVNWGELSDKLTLELMQRDALICGVDKMTAWANGGKCPFYKNIERDFCFKEKKELWEEGKPQLNDLQLFVELCKEKNIKIDITEGK
jgi:hypothetical protein